GEDIKTKLKPGDIVMPLLVGECGQCLNCKSGRTNLCLAYPLTFSGLMLDGTSSFLSCGFTTGFGASWKETQITKGSVVAVNGLGAVGLGVHIYLSINMLNLKKIESVDYCFECTGIPSLLKEIIEASKIGLGTTVSIGAAADNVLIRSLSLINGRTLKGTTFGGVRTRSDLPIVLRKCMNENMHEVFEILKKPDCVKILINFD
nr:hypothetical protein [Tanacetum cinerariifolium]